MKDIKFLIALPETKYFIWQVIVQMNNLKKYGYLKDTIYVVGVKDLNNVNPALIELQKTSEATIHFYLDDRPIRSYMYPSSLRPNVLKKFFKEFPNLSKSYFYIDPDVLFTGKLSFTGLLDNDTWYVSNAKSYLNSTYIKSKSDELFDMMCMIADIDKDLVIKNDNNAGGAQYILKNTDFKFWQRVEFLSGQLYNFMKDTEKTYNPEHPIQSWTADMWAILWLAWKFGHKTKIIKRLDFSWATDKISKWDDFKLYHNAGVFNEDYLFNKTGYTNKHPFKDNFEYVDNTFCSINYVKEIEETKINYTNIIKLI